VFLRMSESLSRMTARVSLSRASSLADGADRSRRGEEMASALNQQHRALPCFAHLFHLTATLHFVRFQPSRLPVFL
jgi:hypothetical protein